ncbi:hypothetical protein COCON_G00233130 [Conger conger]|uniref:Uncharacterized protein n=1 Tax=Conger conger TaxID=82655 RepID=A0A9Q1HMH4_CONCO|nr:hypothetical protein COCON_G00233130 [Conger conger]
MQWSYDVNGQGVAENKVIYEVEISSTFLECSPKSQRTLIYWQFQRQDEEGRQEVWKRERKQRRQRVQTAQAQAQKWRHLQESKKGRNRRTHELERAPRSV